MGKKPKNLHAGKIWTTLRSIAGNDLVRNRARYTIDPKLLDYWPILPQHAIEVEAEISSTEKRAWVQAPKGFGPSHEIELQSPYDFNLTKREWLLEHLHTRAYYLWLFHRNINLASDHDVHMYFNKDTSPEELVSSYEELFAQLPYIKLFMDEIIKIDQAAKA